MDPLKGLGLAVIGLIGLELVLKTTLAQEVSEELLVEENTEDGL